MQFKDKYLTLPNYEKGRQGSIGGYTKHSVLIK